MPALNQEEPPMELHIVNYRGAQVHSATRFIRVSGPWIFFAAGHAADVEGLHCIGATRFIRDGEGDNGYLPAGSPVGTGITLTNISEDGRTIITRTAGGSTVSSSGGKHTTNIGDPGGASRGIQIGDGNAQFNQF
jgi:hypothetical protein